MSSATIDGVGAPGTTEAPTDDAPCPPGTVLAKRYQVKALLGQGGMATVYRATDLMLRREVAVKVLRRYLSAQANVVKRFMREAQTMASLDSPHVVPVYDVGQDGADVFLVMKLFSAPSLHDVIETSGVLPPSRAVALIGQVLDGLGHLHERGLVHRDVKPSNILVTTDERALLLDLGIALDSAASGLTTVGTTLGTPEYMSPEQALGRTLDGRSDLYAVGVVLFEAVTGRLPFDGETRAEIGIRHVTDPPPSPRSFNLALPEALDAAILKALAKQPARRHQTADEMRAALSRALEEPIGAASPSEDDARNPAPTPLPPRPLPLAFALQPTAAMPTPAGGLAAQPTTLHFRPDQVTPLAPMLDQTPPPTAAFDDTPAPAESPTPLPLAAPRTPRAAAAGRGRTLAIGAAGVTLAVVTALVLLRLGGRSESSDGSPIVTSAPAATPAPAPVPAPTVAVAPAPAAATAPSANPSPAAATARPSPAKPAREAVHLAPTRPSERNPTAAPPAGTLGDPLAVARAHLRAGDTAGALRILASATASTPDRAEIYALLGDAHSRTNNRVAAIAAYRRCLALQPEGGEAERVRRRLTTLGGL
ncbi:MAG: protein kinase [Myxococcota bacterium]